jgi:hypothetical protein
VPNTLAHIGFQVPAVRAVMGRPDPKWIFAGLLIPDVPWIVLRFVATARLPVDLYAFHLYAIVQASLALSLVLAAAVALATRAFGRVFLILGVNVLLHLLLDATEIKWGNGVHFFAPFSWRLTSFGLMWPESAVITLVTVVGFGVAVWALVRVEPGGGDLGQRQARARPGFALALVAVYLGAPFTMMNGVEGSDANGVAVLRDRDLRPGRTLEFDRAHLILRSGQLFLRTFTREELRVIPAPSLRPGTVSARARFLDPGTLALDAVHEHRGWPRDLLSVVGLGLIAATWSRDLIRRRRGGRVDDGTGGRVR